MAVIYTYTNYIPLISIFLIIISSTILKQFYSGFNVMNAMQDFMGIFFIVFSIFKIINIKGFAEAYSQYDIRKAFRTLARKKHPDKQDKNKADQTSVFQESSFAMDIPEGLFTRSSREVAKGLKKAVLESNRTKGTKFQSAMSMLNYYINRSGKKLPREDKERLEQAKVELRKIFHKE